MTAIQFGLANATGVPEFMAPAEANQQIAKAMQRVARHYPSVLTERQQDHVMLMVTVGVVAQGQAMAYFHRKAHERAEAAKPVNGFEVAA